MLGLMRPGRVEQVIRAMDFGAGGGMARSVGPTVLVCWGARVLVGMGEAMVIDVVVLCFAVLDLGWVGCRIDGCC